MYKRKKDKTNLIAEWEIKIGAGKHYFDVFLWRDQESFDKNTLDNNPGESAGCVNCAPKCT